MPQADSTSTPTVRSIVLAQLTPTVGDMVGNMETLEQVLAAHAEADIAVFPELFLGGYTTQDLTSQAIPESAAVVADLCDLARQFDTALILGAAEQSADGIYNVALCIDRRGQHRATYRKTQLFGDEAGAFVAGDALTVVELDGVQVGLMICFDLEFPEVARALTRAGAELLVAISANMTPFANDHRVYAQSRALENGRPLVYVNQVGEGERFVFTGGSCGVTADGTLTALGDSEPEARLIDVAIVGSSAERPDYLGELRDPLPPVDKR